MNLFCLVSRYDHGTDKVAYLALKVASNKIHIITKIDKKQSAMKG